MAGPLQRLTPGKPVASLSAGTWNRFADATRQVEAGGGWARLAGDTPAVEARFVTLANATGAARDPYSIVTYTENALDDFPPDADTYPTKAIPVANAKAPAAGSRFAILTNRVESSAENLVRAQVAGLAWAKVDIKTAGDTTCGPVDGQYTHLDSGVGATPILAAALEGEATETGVQWCVILLGGDGVTINTNLAVVSTACPAGNKSGTGTAWKFTPDTPGGEAYLLAWNWTGLAWELVVPEGSTPFDFVSGYTDVTIPTDAFIRVDFNGTLAGGYTISETNSPPVGTFVEVADYLRELSGISANKILWTPDGSAIEWAGGVC